MTAVDERQTGGTATAGRVLPRVEPAAAGLDPARLARLDEVIEGHIVAGRYPGAQIAVARHGRLAALRTYGRARLDPEMPATDTTLWLLFSQTKVLTAAAIWQLVEQGRLRFADRVAEHLPGFERNGKGDITVFEVITHQGGFPSASVPDAAWADHDLLRRAVCDFTLEWTPGTKVRYHPGAAHWVLAMVIEAVTGRDYREVIRDDLLRPIGLGDSIFVGAPDAVHDRCVDMHASENGTLVAMAARNTPEHRRAGVPGGGGYATAEGLTAFYQMLLAGGVLGGVRVLSPRMIQFATRNHTGDRFDEYNGMPMHRGLGPHSRGLTPTIRGLGTLASPATFGHGGAGTSYSWADPESGVSFTYLSNGMAEEPWHTARLDALSNIVHAAIVEP